MFSHPRIPATDDSRDLPSQAVGVGVAPWLMGSPAMVTLGPPRRLRSNKNRRALAAVAWKLVRTLSARHPGRLRIAEAGNCAGGYHVLVLCDGQQRPAETHPLAMLNVGGSLHLIARADTGTLSPDEPLILNLVPWNYLCLATDVTDPQHLQHEQDVREWVATAIARALGL